MLTLWITHAFPSLDQWHPCIAPALSSDGPILPFAAFAVIMDPSQLPPGNDLAHLPAGRPPPGTSPNFVNPVTLKGLVVVINVIFLTLSTVFVSLRLYTRKFLH